MNARMQTRTRRDIARRVADRIHIPSAEADRMVHAVLGAIRDLLMSADPELRLEVRDFGVFEVKRTKAKPRARNPRTGGEMYIPPHRKTHFRPSQRLRRFLNRPIPDESRGAGPSVGDSPGRRAGGPS